MASVASGIDCPNCTRGAYSHVGKKALKPVGSRKSRLKAPVTWRCENCGYELVAGEGSGPAAQVPRPGFQ